MEINLGEYEPTENCLFCGDDECIQGHYMNYKEEIVINLCKICHGDFHEENYYDKINHKFIRRRRRVRLEDMKRVLDDFVPLEA